MREADVDRALGALKLGSGALILDSGCGNGEMLLRALAHDPTWRGLGVDLDPDAIAAAQAAAADRLPGRDVRFEVRDAAEVTGRHDAVLNVGSSHVHGGYPGALRVLRGLVADGGTVVLGEGYWREPPRPPSSPRSAARPRTSSTTSAGCAPRSSTPGSTSRR